MSIKSVFLVKSAFFEGWGVASFPVLASFPGLLPPFLHTASDQNWSRGRPGNEATQSSTTAIVACNTNNALFVLQATIAVVEDWVQG